MLIFVRHDSRERVIVIHNCLTTPHPSFSAVPRPFTLHEGSTSGQDYELRHNEFSWTEEAHMLFVEQPLR